MATVDYRSVRGYWGPNRWPLWVERVVFIALTIVLVSTFGVLMLAGFLGGHVYGLVPDSLQALSARAALNLLFLVSLWGMTLTTHNELFVARDLEMLFSLPLSDSRIFLLKVRRLLAALLQGPAVLALPMITFAVGAELGLRGAIVFPLAVFAVFLLGQMIALLAAFIRPLRTLIYAISVASLLSVPLLVISRDPDALLRRILDSTLVNAEVLRWLPASWIGDLARVSSGASVPAAFFHAAVSCGLVLLVVFAVVVLSRLRYTRERVLDLQQATYAFRDESAATTHNATDWGSWPLSRFLRSRVSPRTFAVLQFIARAEEPLLVDRDLLILTRNFVLASIGSQVFWLTLSGLTSPDFRLFIIAACFTVGWLAATIEIGIVDSGIGQAFRMQVRGKRAGPPLAMTIPVGLADRGDHRHPLIESWPIEIREFVTLCFRYQILRGWATIAFGFPFVLLSGAALRDSSIALCVGFALTAFGSALASIGVGLTYQRHPRRSYWRNFLVGVRLVLVIAATTVLLVWAVAIIGPTAWIVIGVPALFVLMLLASPFIQYAWLVHTHRRRWFDAEYSNLNRSLLY